MFTCFFLQRIIYFEIRNIWLGMPHITKYTHTTRVKSGLVADSIENAET